MQLLLLNSIFQLEEGCAGVLFVFYHKKLFALQREEHSERRQ